ncbi:TetR/AcrR family transcriptional regulator [Neomoorella thermoacetica]|uniref:Fatty acid metabolism regulator protein n=1 Tax=Neomoorella thermoacetica TaxID=1525 RepID=A0A1J5K9N8_NEOTH|nr:TetR/AcrR family transcriptional regulator [Moorella thermoacetica]OIQ07546.1 fatty acid metabolism regulator protein [Moorella thermoacetica]OIQ12361.1 fatty acid metabolism regulator protein [Moorella thermoacetica]
MTVKETSATRQQQIIAAALDIIAKHGLANLTTAAIAQEVGFSEGAIFKHFPGKEAILAAAVKSVGGRLASQAAAIAGRKDVPPGEKLQLILDLHLSLAATSPAMPRILFSDELYTSYASLKEIIRGIIAGYTRTLEAIFNEGMETGEFKRFFPAHTLAFIFIGLIQSTIIRWRLDDGIDPREQGQHIYRAIMFMVGR